MAEPFTTDTDESVAPATPVSPRRRLGQPRRIPPFVIILSLLLVAGLGFAAGSATNGSFTGKLNTLLGNQELDTSTLQETYTALSKNFDGELDQKALIEGANKGMVDAAGDQYTIYMNKEESTSFDDALSGNIGGGIGVEISMRNNVPTAVRVLENNPAQKAGVMVNDSIVKINGESTEGKTLDQVTTNIRGEIGTTVKLTLNRSGEEKEISITREQVTNPSAYGTIQDSIGVLTITRFDDETGSLARAVATDFKNKGVKGVIVDLRGNGGGYVTAAQSVAGIWLDKKLVTTERRNTKVTEELKSTGTPILNGMKTVILVNESSASASEIVAGALRDHKAATLVGQTTFGKGSVQKLVNLSDGATLKVTVARWFTPSGLNISEKGITPDTEVERTADDINANRDPQLQAALKAI